MFLSKITPPDSTYIEFDALENGDLLRGIRTLGEVAHFVRCIPFKNHENQNIWSSPDFLLTMRVGSIDEHALLMASMFRAVKYETVEEIEKKFHNKKQVALDKSKLNNLAENLNEKMMKEASQDEINDLDTKKTKIDK